MGAKVELQEELKLKTSLNEDIKFIRSLKGCSKRKTKEEKIKLAKELTPEEGIKLAKYVGLIK